MYVAAAAVLLTAACAHVCIKPADDATHGFRYYLPRPYLLVTRDAAQIVWLPDLSQPYAIQPKCGIGTMKLDLTLEDGWKLTGVNHDVDTKVPETIDAVGKALASVATAATAVATMAKTGGNGASPDLTDSLRRLQPFRLYGFDYDASKSFVTGLRLLDSMPKDAAHK
jgi:hypothetical protein